MKPTHPITPCLWFEDQAEDAAELYTGIFKNSKITQITRYTQAGQEVHHGKPGAVLTVAFELDGQSFTALNGGPAFKFNEAISLQVPCETQEEVDYYWDKLRAGGSIQQCGWLKDKYGVSWQIFPAALVRMIADPDTRKASNVMNAMLKMRKIELEPLEQAYRA